MLLITLTKIVKELHYAIHLFNIFNKITIFLNFCNDKYYLSNGKYVNILYIVVDKTAIHDTLEPVARNVHLSIYRSWFSEMFLEIKMVDMNRLMSAAPAWLARGGAESEWCVLGVGQREKLK